MLHTARLCSIDTEMLRTPAVSGSCPAEQPLHDAVIIMASSEARGCAAGCGHLKLWLRQDQASARRCDPTRCLSCQPELALTDLHLMHMPPKICMMSTSAVACQGFKHPHLTICTLHDSQRRPSCNPVLVKVLNVPCVLCRCSGSCTGGQPGVSLCLCPCFVLSTVGAAVPVRADAAGHG